MRPTDAYRQWAYYGIQSEADLMRESYLEAEREMSSPIQ
jgi:hypothetical protein